MKKLFCLFYCLLLSSCIHLSSSSCVSAGEYPEHWWSPVTSQNIPEWEVLPQAAKRENNEVILSKRNELGLLSNFAATPFTLDGQRFASLEGFWQAMKFPENKADERNRVQWPFTRSEVEQMTAFQAKNAGKKAEKIMQDLNISWITYRGQKLDYRGADQDKHYEIILAATRAKIEQNPEVKKVLLQTGHLTLRPDHKQEPNSPPAWRYFEIYMKLRSEFRQCPSRTYQSAKSLF